VPSVKFELYLHVISLQILILTDYVMTRKVASLRSTFVSDETDGACKPATNMPFHPAFL